MAINLQFLQILILYLSLTGQLSFMPKLFTVQKYSSCPEDNTTSLKFSGIVRMADRNKFIAAGELNITEESGYPLELEINVFRCALDMTNCNDLDTVIIHHVCKRIKDKNRPWTPFFESITPPLGCPLKVGNYIMSNSSFDLTMVAELPGLENYIYISYVKLYEPGVKTFTGQLFQSSKGNLNSRHLIFCVFSQVSITAIKRTRSNKKN